MATATTFGKRSIPVWILCVFLGLFFLLIGGGKLTGTLNTVQFFAAIGWGQWFRYFTGLLDVIGAILLFVPRLTFYGACILAASVGTATLICLFLIHQNAIAPLIFTLLAAFLAWLTWPHRAR